MLPVTTWKCGIVSSDLSGWEKFEVRAVPFPSSPLADEPYLQALDPAVWCPRGYAIASVDIRGSGHSSGSVQIMGQNMGEDGFDVIEELAKKDWCNGKVGLAGNSVRHKLVQTRGPRPSFSLTFCPRQFLAISQWHIAAQQPPSLKAIAPWEGCGDLFRLVPIR